VTRPGTEGIEDEIILADNADILPEFESAFFQLIYIDPPFNTGNGESTRAWSSASLQHPPVGTVTVQRPQLPRRAK
jgi:16S rRNA G966 N2-methylase RsmD